MCEASRGGGCTQLLGALQLSDEKAHFDSREAYTNLHALQSLVQNDVTVRFSPVEKVHRSALLFIWSF